MSFEFRLMPGVVTQRVGEELILLDTRKGGYFDLNPTGAWMLTRLLEGAALAQVVAEGEGRYRVEASRLAADLEGLVQELLAAGLVQQDPAGSD